jgi:hypothetical protein
MRIRTIGIAGTCALVITACGSTGGKAPTQPGTPSPINLSVSVNDSRISVSPRFVGAGPVVFTFVNQSSRAEALAISRTGTGFSLARTAPINPQGTTQVSVYFRPGIYTIATARHGTDAQLSEGSRIRATFIRIGRERANSNNDLLSP